MGDKVPIRTTPMKRPRVGREWWKPGAYPVADGVYRIPLPLPLDGLRAVNVYVHESDNGLLAVDGGWALDEARLAFDEALRSIGHRLADIRRFIVTHHHRDHYTQAVSLRRDTDAWIALGEAERPSLTAAGTEQGWRGAAHQELLTRAGAEEHRRALAATGLDNHDGVRGNLDPPDHWLSDGETVPVVGERSLRVVHTPGHTRGHLCFHDEARNLLYTGDHVLPHITPSIGFESLPGQSPLRDYLNSLTRVRGMPDAVMLPAHGHPGPSVHERVDELLDHHVERLDATGAAVSEDGSTAFEVASRLTWTSRRRSLHELDEFNQMLAICETLAHLDVMVQDGRMLAENNGSVRLYRP